MNQLFNPAHFTANGTAIDGPQLSSFLLVFIDDILVFSKSAEEHKQHLKIVFYKVCAEKLQIKPSKCVWRQTELPYLVFIVGKDGFKLDPKKVQAVADWPRPTTPKDIQRFLGLTHYSRKYILGYSKLAAPSSNLTQRNENFLWTDSCEIAFQKLKTALTEAHVLAFPGPNVPFNLVTDSCGYGIGVVLLQQDRPVAFYCRTLAAAERNCVNHKQELLAAESALKVFRCYLQRFHFTWLQPG